jgi:hypothetical protein
VTRTSSWVQLRALFGLRWLMVRSDMVRVALILTAVFLGWLMVLVANGANALEPAAFRTAVELAPQAFLGFGVLAVIAPLTAGGGNEIIPPDQVVAYPIRPRTQFLGGLLLAPVNLVWLLQILAIIAETAFLTRGGHALPGAVTALAYVTAVTALGQMLAWSIVGLRQTRRGRQTVALTAVGLLATGVLLVRSGLGSAAIEASPTQTVVSAIAAGAHGSWARWGLTTGLLAALTAVGLGLGARTCGWALRRPGDAGAVRASRVLPRRKAHASPLRALVAVDRASVWRAPALRRGGLVLALLPGLAAAGAQVPWQSLVVLPGLVAAGAGLLFGVNAFCLDVSGAVFLASLPHDPRLVARAKTIVLTETVLAAASFAALAGSLRSPGQPTATELVAIAASTLACSAMVVSQGMASSVRRPHKAELAGPRDAVAPPGALVLASVRLALPTGIVGILLGTTAESHRWWLPLTLAVPAVLLSAMSLRRSLGRYADPLVRSRIVQTVSAG